MNVKEYKELRSELELKLQGVLEKLMKTNVIVALNDKLESVVVTIKQETKEMDALKRVTSHFSFSINDQHNMRFAGFAHTILTNGGEVIGTLVRPVKTDLQTLFLVHKVLQGFFKEEGLLVLDMPKIVADKKEEIPS